MASFSRDAFADLLDRRRGRLRLPGGVSFPTPDRLRLRLGDWNLPSADFEDFVIEFKALAVLALPEAETCGRVSRRVADGPAIIFANRYSKPGPSTFNLEGD